jgi:hypothetical protein
MPNTEEVDESDFEGEGHVEIQPRERSGRERKVVQKFIPIHEKKAKPKMIHRMNFKHREALEAFQ